MCLTRGKLKPPDNEVGGVQPDLRSRFAEHGDNEAACAPAAVLSRQLMLGKPKPGIGGDADVKVDSTFGDLGPALH